MDCKATRQGWCDIRPARFSGVGKHTIRDTSPLTKKRMGTIDDDVADRAVDYIKWWA